LFVCCLPTQRKKLIRTADRLCAPGPPDHKCSVSEDGEYMSFGLSGDDTRSKMIGGDVAVAWVDKTTLKGYAVDYFLESKSQCAGTRGSCPDERLTVTRSLSHPHMLRMGQIVTSFSNSCLLYIIGNTFSCHLLTIRANCLQIICNGNCMAE
jgi:hypothetical protein